VEEHGCVVMVSIGGWSGVGVVVGVGKEHVYCCVILREKVSRRLYLQGLRLLGTVLDI